jgi:hypothetical protein
MLEPPLLTAYAPGQKRRYTPLASLPKPMIDAVIAIEDRRFFEHPGVDPIGAIGALITNLRGKKAYLAGGSTLTQQIVKNTFLTPAKTLRRKMQEQFMALVLDSRFTKNQILELYSTTSRSASAACSRFRRRQGGANLLRQGRQQSPRWRRRRPSQASSVPSALAVPPSRAGPERRNVVLEKWPAAVSSPPTRQRSLRPNR